MPAMKGTEEAFEVEQRAYESVIDMIETVTMWGLSKSQQQTIERFKAHLIKNIKIMADIVDEPS